MTLSLSVNSISNDVGQMLSTVLRERFGKMSSPVKRLARALGISEPTARGMLDGRLPATPTFLHALDLVGHAAAAKVLGRVIGRQDSNAQRLAAMEASLQEFQRHVEEIRVANTEGRAGALSVLGFGSADVARPRAERARAADLGGEGRDRAGGLGQSGGSHLALIETRRLDGLPGDEGAALRRHLTAFDNVVSLDAARAIAKGDNLGRTGLAYKHPGEDWKALVAPENRLWTPSADPRPITEFEGNVAALRRDLDEAARSLVPVYAVHAGALVRDGNLIPFHSAVARIPGRAKCGAEMVLTDFVRRGAA